MASNSEKNRNRGGKSIVARYININISENQTESKLFVASKSPLILSLNRSTQGEQ